MKRITLALLLAAICCGALFAQTASTATPSTATAAAGALPEPYKAAEFPGWARDLRRFEIVTIGAFPFAIFYTSFSLDLLRFIGGTSMGFSISNLGRANPFVFKDVDAFDLSYAPWPVKSSSSYVTNSDEKAFTIIMGAALALGIGITDYLIVKARERAALRKKASLRMEAPTVDSDAQAQAGAEEGGGTAASLPEAAEESGAASGIQIIKEPGSGGGAVQP
jgi:hypothetical protein